VTSAAETKSDLTFDPAEPNSKIVVIRGRCRRNSAPRKLVWRFTILRNSGGAAGAAVG